MRKIFKLFTPVIVLLMVLIILLVIVTFFADPRFFILSALLSALFMAIAVWLLQRANKNANTTLTEIYDGILYANSDVFYDTSLPVMAVYDAGEIIWYNDSCLNQVLEGRDLRGQHIADLFPNLDIRKTSSSKGVNVSYNRKDYTAFVTYSQRQEGNLSVIYLVDDNQLKHESYEYQQSKSSIALVQVDNYEEMMQDYKESDRAQIANQIEHLISHYFTRNDGFVTRMERDKMLVVIQERGIKKMIDQKFELLDQVRGLQPNGHIPPTLSIGIGRNAASLADSEGMARQALDMCLGRGGDQATIRTATGYEFYGGVSKGVEKRTKVRSRIIASALSELIESSSNVIIMGHRFADLDALGAGVGVLSAVRSMNRPAFICIDQEKNLVVEMLDELKASGYKDDDFRSPEMALSSVNSNTLLIIVDVHVPHLVQSEELYRACKNVAVIDHHRKLVGFIDNAVIFYHEPNASSTSEMVSELIQYFPSRPTIGRAEANAMLAGISLDTKNFIMHTGTRTFEAAAWLKRMGADTIEVRKMFTTSMSSYQEKTEIVSSAQVYLHCAIASTTSSLESIRIVASQAADDLMNISGVEASFVLYLFDGAVNISARSFGSLNVQLIMEKLGGGGHHTMAAAQIKEQTLDDVIPLLKAAIESYYAALPAEQRPEEYTKSLIPTAVAMEAVQLEEQSAVRDAELPTD